MKPVYAAHARVGRAQVGHAPADNAEMRVLSRSALARLVAGVSILATIGTAGCRRARNAPAAAALVSQADTLDTQGQRDAAIALYRRALLEDPDAYHAHYSLARALDLAGQYDEARREFSAAIALAPDSDKEQALRMMGIAWTFVGDVDQATRYFRDVFDRRLAASNFPGAADEANELGRVSLELGDPDRAETWYRRGHDVAAREPDRASWRVDLADMRWAHAQARIAARRGQPDEARRQEAIVKALLDKGGNEDQRIEYPYLLGYDDFYLGDYLSAVTQLRQADQKDPFILLLLAEASDKLGQAEAARGYYQQVLDSRSHAINAAFARPIARQQLGLNPSASTQPHSTATAKSTPSQRSTSGQ
jgi:tetratricopeptide (TPR) repeat protein